METTTAASFDRAVRPQSNASLCGPASIANVIRSLKQGDVTETDVLSGTSLCSLGFCFLGLTLDELADVARRSSGRRVTILRGLTLEEFREQRSKPQIHRQF